MFPEILTVPLDVWVNDLVSWLLQNYGDYFQAVADGLLVPLVRLDWLLRNTPWFIVVGILGMATYAGSRRLPLTAGVIVALLLIGILGMWDLAMQTLAIMIISIVLSLIVGIPFGILLSFSDRVRSIVLPVLDVMQTLPVFVHLIPAILFFGLGKVPAIIATVIYASPPVIRLTDLGLRLVDKEIVEASNAFGASWHQRLLGVQLPLALPNIMQGINQTTMLALSMVVIASMVGVRGLGEEVLLGIQRLDVGRGMVAGISIVALAVALDRMTQSFSRSGNLEGGSVTAA